jgi:NADPH-dependent ferric siderophore reductase
LDGRRNNKGVKGNKGGRPPKADEIKIIEQMDAIAAPSEAWRALWVKCQEGDVQAVKTWLNYRFGMPKQSVDLDATIRDFPSPIIELPNE